MAHASCREQSCSRVCWLLCSMSSMGWTLLHRSVGKRSEVSCSSGQPPCMAGSAHDAADPVLEQPVNRCWVYRMALSIPTHAMDLAGGLLICHWQVSSQIDLQTEKQ